MLNRLQPSCLIESALAAWLYALFAGLAAIIQLQNSLSGTEFYCSGPTAAPTTYQTAAVTASADTGTAVAAAVATTPTAAATATGRSNVIMQ